MEKKSQFSFVGNNATIYLIIAELSFCHSVIPSFRPSRYERVRDIIFHGKGLKTEKSEKVNKEASRHKRVRDNTCQESRQKITQKG